MGGVNKNPVLSHKKVRTYCAEVGIPAPTSLAEDNAECAQWEATHGAQYPVVGALRIWRKANILLRKCEAIQNRLMSNGRMCFSLKYHGAGATGRLAGTDGWNIQNLPRSPFFGVNIRKLLIPAPERKFVIGDFAQIEPRITCWLSGNTELLAELAKGHNLYEADARLSGLWTGEPGTFKKTNPEGYQLQKAQTLGVAYGMGAFRFQEAARSQLGLNLSVELCRQIITDWHARNPGVRVRWDEYEYGLARSFHRDEDYSIKLPSGRALHYMRIERVGQDGKTRYTACSSLESRRNYYWGGKLFENVVQSIARDVLRDTVLRLEDEGIPVVFTAHDEVVCEVPEDFPPDKILRLMVVPSSWAKTLPLAAEILETKSYTK